MWDYILAPDNSFARGMSTSATGQGLSLVPLDPRIHSTTALVKEKLILVLMKHVASLVAMFLFSASFSDSLL